jgi:hypothetical protein
MSRLAAPEIVAVARSWTVTVSYPICGHMSARIHNENVSAQTVHAWLLDLLPPPPAVVLDVDAGRWPEDLLTAHDLFQPPRIRAYGAAVRVCPHCGHLYWEGSHVRRIRRRLESFAHGGGRRGSRQRASVLSRDRAST